MGHKTIWVLFFFIIGFIASIIISNPIQQAGDIVEYYGITESLTNHAGIILNTQDKKQLEKVLHPAYFQDPGYYIKGRNNNVFPVHFPFYSLLVLPFRFLIELLRENPLYSLPITNVFIFATITYIILARFLHSLVQQAVFLIILFLSPLIWFLIWPGPDIFSIMFLLLGIFYFFANRLGLASILVIIASWQNQPLISIALGFIGFYLFQSITVTPSLFALLKRRNTYVQTNGKTKITLKEILSLCINHAVLITFIPKIIGRSLFLILLLLIPYFYNYYVFGVFSPWVLLQDGWTKINGFGFHNLSIQKFYEQFFDLNIGLFWYAPFLVIGGFYFLSEVMQYNKKAFFVFLLLLVTAFLYHTNPAWHYGTSGYGPTRHVLYAIPIFIYFFVTYFKKKPIHFFLLLGYIATQLPILWMNNFIVPNLENSLYHSPYTTYVLNNFPSFYNPTPEIFIDRTTHKDLPYPRTAIYQKGDNCTKAYVLITDVDQVKKTCGSIPNQYAKEFDNQFLRKANYSRTAKTIEATFWPDEGSCGKDIIPTPERPYVCMRTLADVMYYTKVFNPNRFTTVEGYEEYPGIWKLKLGTPVTATIPPGYIINHYSFEGIYVDYK